MIDLTDSPSPIKRRSEGPSEAGGLNEGNGGPSEAAATIGGPSQAAATTGGPSQAAATTGGPSQAATTGGPSELTCTSDESTTSSESSEADSDHLCIVCKEGAMAPRACTICGNIICKLCHIGLITNKEKTCPICRKSLKLVTLHL